MNLRWRAQTPQWVTRGIGAAFILSFVASLLPAQSVAGASLGPAVEVVGSEFLRVLNARRLSDGRVLVSDVGDGVLLVVSVPGSSPDTVGRRGRGPGEYGRTGGLYSLGGDSTLLEDHQYGWRHLVVGTQIVGILQEPSRRAIDVEFVGAGADGSFAELHVTASGTNELGRRLPPLRRYADSLALLKFRSTGDVDTIARLQGGFLGTTTVRKVQRGAGMTYEFQSPLESVETAWMFPDGWIAVLRKSPYRVDWIRPSDEYIRSPALPFEIVRVDRRQRARAIREAHFGPDGAGFSEEDFPPWPTTLPPFLKNAMTALSDGRVIIRRAPDARVNGVLHDVVDRSGRLRQRIVLGANQRIVGADRHGVFVVTRDEDGWEVLTSHRIAPGTG